MATPPLRLHAGRYLQSPVWHFRHPDTGRLVHLVGTIHEGEPGYYQHMLALVVELSAQGGAVHHEGTRLGEFMGNPPEHATETERELLALHPAHHDMVHTVSGWTDMFTGMGGGWPAGWQRHDLDEIQIMRSLGHELYRQYLRYLPTATTADSGSRLRRWHRTTSVRVMRYWYFYRVCGGLQFPPKPTDPVFLDARNEAALAGVDGTGQDLVLVWGGGHLPGIGAGLQRRGFVHTGTTWLTVGRLPRTGRVLVTSLCLPPTAVFVRAASFLASRWSRSRAAVPVVGVTSDPSPASDLAKEHR